MKKINKIGLALGGGGARGFAHLGVLKAFEENNIKFDYICGTSVGALIGALYAGGVSVDTLIDFAINVKEKDIKSNIIPFMPSNTNNLQNLINIFLPNYNIENLQIPFFAVCVDIRTGEEIIINKGNLCKVVAGSCAVPGIFEPVEFDKYLLFDGGLSNTIPTDVLKNNYCDKVVGVDINSFRGMGTQSKKYIDLILASISVMMKHNSLKGYVNADVMLKPDLRKFKSNSFNGAKEMIEIGYKTAIENMDKIKSILNENKNRKFKLSNLFWFKKGKNEK